MIRVSKNHRLFFSVFALVLTLSACDTRSDDEKIADRLKLASLHLESDSLEEAKTEFENVLDLDRNNLDALRNLLAIAEQQQNGDAAFAYLTRLSNLETDDYALKIKLGTLHLLADQLDEAIKLAEDARALDDYDKDGFLLYTTVAQRLGYLDASFDAAREFLEISPNNPTALALLVREQVELRHNDKALDLANEALAIHPLDIQLNRIKAYILLNEDQVDEPAAIFETLTREYPTNVQVHQELAKVYMQQDKIELASAVMAKLADAEGAAELQRFAEIDFLTKTDQEAVAVTRLQDWVAAFPDRNAYRLKLAQLYQARGDSEQARPLYEQILVAEEKTNEVYRAAATSLAGMVLSEGNTERASELIDTVFASDPEYNGALLVRAGIADARKDTESALTDLESILAKSPEDTQARQYAAQLHYQNRTYSEALTHYRYLEANQGLPTALLAGYGDTLLQLGLSEQAYELLSVPINQGNKSPGMLDAYTRAAMLTGRADAALYGLDTLLTLDDSNPNYYQAKGNLYLQTDQYAKAVTALEKAFSLSGDTQSIADSLVQAYVAGEAVPRGIQFFQAQAEAEKNSASLISLANLYASDKQINQAERVFRENQESNPNEVRSYMSWAIAYIRQDNSKRAHSILDRGIKAVEDKAQLLTVQAQLFEREKQYAEAMASYKQILALDESSILAANNFTHIAVTYDGSREALEEARSLVPVLEPSESPAVQDTLAWLYYSLEDYESAYRYALSATKDDAPVAELYYHMGMIQLKRNKDLSAKRAFERALEIDAGYQLAQQQVAILDAETAARDQELLEAREAKKAEAARILEQSRQETEQQTTE